VHFRATLFYPDLMSFYYTNQIQGKAGAFSTIIVGAFSLDIHMNFWKNVDPAWLAQRLTIWTIVSWQLPFADDLSTTEQRNL